MIRLTKEQLLMMHEELIRQTGGASGMRDEGLARKNEKCV